MMTMKTTCRSPAFAEQAFYTVFEGNDVDAMMAARALQDAIECIHPANAAGQGGYQGKLATSVRERQTAPLAAQSALKDSRRTTFSAHFA